MGSAVGKKDFLLVAAALKKPPTENAPLCQSFKKRLIRVAHCVLFR